MELWDLCGAEFPFYYPNLCINMHINLFTLGLITTVKLNAFLLIPGLFPKKREEDLEKRAALDKIKGLMLCLLWRVDVKDQLTELEITIK